MILALINSPIIVIVNPSNSFNTSTMTMIGLLEVAQFYKRRKKRMKTSNKFYIKAAVVLLLLAAIIFGTVACTPTTTPAPSTTPTPAPTATPTTEATPTPAEGKPKEIPTTVDLPEPGGDWIPEKVDKPWNESSIEKWGNGDIDDSTYSYYVSEVYEDPDGVYFRLYHFRVYVYEGRQWVKSEVFPFFKGKIVMGEGPKFLVLGEESVEVWEVDYSPDSVTWTFSRLFAAVADTPENIRVFGDWAFEDSASKAYIASNEEEEIWTISTGSITTRHYDDVVFSNTDIFVVEGTTLTRVAYESQFRFKTRSGFTSTNESALEGGTTLLEFGDNILAPIKFAGGAVHEKNGMVFVQESIGRIIFS